MDAEREGTNGAESQGQAFACATSALQRSRQTFGAGESNFGAPPAGLNKSTVSFQVVGCSVDLVQQLDHGIVQLPSKL